MRAIVLVGISYAGLYVVQFSRAEENILYPATCSAVIDNNLSPEMIQQVRRFVDEVYDSKQSMHHFIAEIQKRFSVVQSVSVSLDNPDSMNIHIHAHRADFLVNHDLVAVESGAAFSRDIFSTVALEKLHRVDYCFQQRGGVLDACALAFFKQLSARFFDDYSIRWKSCDFVLIDHKAAGYSVLVSSDWKIDLDELALCCEIQKNGIQDQKKKKHKEKFVCDLRFKGQVVVRRIL
jgi:hypothetical protein